VLGPCRDFKNRGIRFGSHEKSRPAKSRNAFWCRRAVTAHGRGEVRLALGA
jgi:hypothetical protein